MSEEAIAAFWKWWPTAHPKIEVAIKSGDFGDLVDDIAAHVSAISPDLQWEMCPGHRAEHAFIVTASSDMDNRGLCERWLKHATPSDTWEFHPARQRRPLFTLKIDGREFEEDLFRVKLEESERLEKIHVELFHPTFKGAESKLKTMVAFLTLDGLLGEDDVERFIGAIETTEESPGDERNNAIQALQQAVDDLRKRATGARWTVMASHKNWSRRVASINLGLKRIDHPLFDLHIAVTRKLRVNEGTDLSEKEAVELAEHEQTLLDALGDDILFLGSETGGGERVLHFFAREDAGREPLHAFCEAHRATMDEKRDPRWQVASRFH